jgi:uncharacterized protein YabN with tetrapyrrole methylase and pyrophosphatase domain
MGQKAGRVGFDWPDVSFVREKVTEELDELDDALKNGTDADIEHEIGDVLFAVSQWSRHTGFDPEQALLKSCKRFENRFSSVLNDVHKNGKNIEDCDMNELEALWRKAKLNESR